MIDLPEDHRDIRARRLAHFGGHAGLARHETLLAIHNSGLGEEMADLRGELRHMQRLIKERVARPGGDWLTVDEAGQRLKMSRKAIYCSVERGGPLAQAATRVGRRLRFSREAVDALLRGSLRPGRRSVLIPARDTSPARSGR